jgi:isopentenyl diphosphate isomerase/L-lactate dehydrogenase-like FMN-dependent dehydrogenase
VAVVMHHRQRMADGGRSTASAIFRCRRRIEARAYILIL